MAFERGCSNSVSSLSLLGEERSELQQLIAKEGYGAIYPSHRNPNGHWGRKF